MRRFPRHERRYCEQEFAANPTGEYTKRCGRGPIATCELCGMDLCGDCLLLPCMANDPNGEHRPIGLGELERTA